MKLIFPGITQADFDYALDCMEVCKHKHAKEYGFPYPYFAPGGAYGAQWWQLDSSLTLCGYKWYDRAFAETALLNFVTAQKDDGRICLYGGDILPEVVAGGDRLSQTLGVSSLPKVFDVAYHIVRGTTDNDLRESVYSMMKKYIDWWFADRLDEGTGLITAVFEETLVPYLGCAGEYAPVDTNTEVYVGCHYTALLAESLGKTQDADVLNARKVRLKNSINQYLWNEEKGAYYPYSIKDGKPVDCLMVSTFFPLRLGIASAEQRDKLIKLMQDHEHFNWDTIPLTTVSKCDKRFVTTTGEYQGNASWSGNVWSLSNEMVIRGLLDCREYDLAAELALKTIYAFNHNCAEFINPFDGSGHGVIQYAWTASQYTELIIEVIFGIDYHPQKAEVTISPKLTEALKNSHLVLENIKLSDEISLDVFIDHGTVSYSVSTDCVRVIIL